MDMTKDLHAELRRMSAAAAASRTKAYWKKPACPALACASRGG
jgi:hypothetical protein